MIHNYKTGRLLPHLVALGGLLILTGILLTVTQQWVGLLFVLIGFVLFFFRHGVLIDTDKQEAKQYSGIGFIKSGTWQDISIADSLQIITISESQAMSMLSINRLSYQDIDKLYLVLPDENIILMKGTSKKIVAPARELAAALKLELVDKTKAPY